MGAPPLDWWFWVTQETKLRPGMVARLVLRGRGQEAEEGSVSGDPPPSKSLTYNESKGSLVYTVSFRTAGATK